MTRSGHNLTGLSAGVLFAGIAYHLHLDISWQLIVPAVWFGALAPDRLEFPTRNHRGDLRRLIPHRTLTHWWAVWVALGAWGYLHPGMIGWAATSVALGALVHLLGDWPNPMGIPFWLPWRRHSLRMWRSGEREIPMVLATALLAALPWMIG